MWAFVAIAGILWLAYMNYLDHQQKMAKVGASSPEGLRALAGRLDAVEEDRDRLRARVEALEAIVTDDGFDLEREARRAGVAGRLSASVVGNALADPPHPTASDVTDAARRARTS